jgi:phage tail-like protein
MNERLYQLFPEVYRYWDYYEGQPLRALMAVLEQVFDKVEEDIRAQNENWFIETCAARIVPYIGALVGAGETDDPAALPTARTLVADAIALRRRKGSRGALEHALHSATGWPAHVAEYWENTGSTQDIAAPSLHRGRLWNLRTAGTAPAGDAFDTSAHTGGVRTPRRPLESARLGPVPGRYGARFIGVFLWRLGSYLVTRGEPRQVSPAIYTLNPLGADMRLFNQPSASQPFDRVIERGDMPAPLTYETLRRPPGEPPVEIFVRGAMNGDYERIPHSAIYVGPFDEHARWARRRRDASGAASHFRAALDPIRGRLGFPPGAIPHDVRVTYSFGFSANLGGGPYDRPAPAVRTDDKLWRALVMRNTMRGPGVYQSFREALAAWAADPERPDGLIRIGDSAVHRLEGAKISLAGRILRVEAVSGEVPSFLDDLRVEGGPPRSALELEGLWMDGGIGLEGALTLRVRHCTIGPHRSRMALRAISGGPPADLAITIGHSILGRVRIPAQGLFHASSSIFDGQGGDALFCPEGKPGASSELRQCTFLGPVRLQTIELACSSLFTGPLTIHDRGAGCIRYCYLPHGSATPERYRCLPDKPVPRFTSVRYGDAGYCQLRGGGASPFHRAASDGGEVGAFHDLRQASRVTELQRILEDFTPLGLERQVFYET